MFLGQYKHTVDAKGRLSIPRKFLEPLQDPAKGRMFFGTRGLENCIFLFLPQVWEQVVQQVRESSLGSAEARGFSRMFFSFARELPVDGSGRILLPAEHRELAGIDRDAMLVGVDQRIEIWSPEGWAGEGERNAGAYEDQAKEIFRA